jgi:hypothetical protein
VSATVGGSLGVASQAGTTGGEVTNINSIYCQRIYLRQTAVLAMVRG